MSIPRPLRWHILHSFATTTHGEGWDPSELPILERSCPKKLIYVHIYCGNANMSIYVHTYIYILREYQYQISVAMYASSSLYKIKKVQQQLDGTCYRETTESYIYTYITLPRVRTSSHGMFSLFTISLTCCLAWIMRGSSNDRKLPAVFVLLLEFWK